MSLDEDVLRWETEFEKSGFSSNRPGWVHVLLSDVRTGSADEAERLLATAKYHLLRVQEREVALGQAWAALDAVLAGESSVDDQGVWEAWSDAHPDGPQPLPEFEEA